MPLSQSQSENLSTRDFKFLLGSLAVIIIGTIAGLYVYNDIIKKRQQTLSLYYRQQNQYNKTGGMNNIVTKPPLKLKITTCEYYDNDWHPVVRHTFYGNSEEEINSIVEAHRKTDSFFDSSFDGIFRTDDVEIILKNEISEIKEN
ncbi:MAG: hypothetical protein PHP08_00225 [Candidatus Dojkabacteria bacterium]|nr:hypothetical protein [Candidatus Dojkabacteria bacterium]